MAPAARRSRRQASEQISEGDTTQARRNEDVDSDEEASPPARRSKVKNERNSVVPKKTARKKPEPVEEDGDAEEPANELEEEEFDRDKYINQPLNVKEGERIHGYGGDWEISRKGFRIDAVEMARSLAGNMAEYAQGKEGVTGVEELDQMMKDMLDYDQVFRLHQEALNGIHQRVRRGEMIADVIASYEVAVREKKETYNAKTSRQKYAQDEDYVQFQQVIFEVNHPGEAMPPITEFIPREDGDESDDDDDIQVGGVTQDYKCPLSLMPLTDPMTSQLCQHSFSREPIREYLKGGAKRCPAAGCNQMLSMDDLKGNKQLARRVKDAARREKMRSQPESDMEEVID